MSTLNKDSRSLVVDLINADNGTSFGYDELVLSPPVENDIAVNNRNTSIVVTSSNEFQFDGSQTLYYNRLDFGTLFTGLLPSLGGQGLTDISGLLPELNATYGLGLTMEDLVAQNFPANPIYPLSLTLVANSNSYAYTGQFSVVVQNTAPNIGDNLGTTVLGNIGDDASNLQTAIGDINALAQSIIQMNLDRFNQTNFIRGLAADVQNNALTGIQQALEIGGIDDQIRSLRADLTETQAQIANPTTGVVSFNGRSGPVVPTSGDYTTDQVTEGTNNLYFTGARVAAALAQGTGITLTTVNGITTISSTVSGGTGTVTDVSIVAANGFAGTTANETTTPALTISVSVTGILKGDGTGVSQAIEGVDFSPGTSTLATGIVKSTTGTGALSIATASDFPILNQDTTGNSATATVLATPRNINGVAFDGSADITVPNKKLAGINNQIGTSYTLVLADAGKDVLCTNAAAITLTVPPNANVAFDVGTMIAFSQGDVGAVTAVGAAGVTIVGANGVATTAKYDARVLEKIATDTWRVW